MSASELPIAFLNSINEIRATLTDTAGDGVTGATGTVTVREYIDDAVGDELEHDDVTWPEDLDEVGAGVYKWAAPWDLLEEGRFYVAEVQFTEPGERFGRLLFRCAADGD